jgi:hypothetical protein
MREQSCLARRTFMNSPTGEPLRLAILDQCTIHGRWIGFREDHLAVQPPRPLLDSALGRWERIRPGRSEFQRPTVESWGSSPPMAV